MIIKNQLIGYLSILFDIIFCELCSNSDVLLGTNRLI